MMGGLLYKNLLLYRVELILVAVFQLVISGTVLLNCLSGMASRMAHLLLYGALLLMTGFMESGLFAPDEKPAARCFLISTPAGAKGHIASKYLMLLFVNLGILVCCFLTDLGAVALTGDKDLMTGGMLIVLVGGNLLMEAISLPFIVYFGSKYGMNAKGTALGLLLLLGLVYVLFGDISHFLREDFLEALGKLLDRELRLAMPFVGGLAFWLSYRLSTALFRKGSENYD